MEHRQYGHADRHGHHQLMWRWLADRVVRPEALTLTTPDQAWFWTAKWQKGERKADREYRRGRIVTYLTDEDFLRDFG